MAQLNLQKVRQGTVHPAVSDTKLKNVGIEKKKEGIAVNTQICKLEQSNV
jgi:hypothetical protein